MLDSRYPNLFRVADSGLPPDLMEKCHRFVGNIMRRVPGVRGVFNRKTGELFFYFGEPSGGPLCIPVTGDEPWSLDQRDEDDSVAILNLALVPFAVREKQMERAEKSQKQEAEQKVEKNKEDARPGLIDLTKRHFDRKRGVAPTSVFIERPSGLVVPG